MAVEERQREVPVLALCHRTETRTYYTTSDQTEFEKKDDAEQHELLWESIKQFKKTFSKQKKNFREGNMIFNKVVIPVDVRNYKILDAFWIKIENAKEEEALSLFLREAYATETSVYIDIEGNTSPPGKTLATNKWLYCMILDPLSAARKKGVIWIELSYLEERVKIIENNFPEKDVTYYAQNDSLLDLD